MCLSHSQIDKDAALLIITEHEALLNILKLNNRIVKIKYKDHTFLEHMSMYDDVSLRFLDFSAKIIVP